MKAYIFFSVHEEIFHRVALGLRDYGVTEFSGFVWGVNQIKVITDRGIDYRDLVTFTRDLLPHCDDGAPPDLEWLAKRERELGVSIQRMLASERHLLAGRSFEQIMRMAEVALREVAAAYDRIRPDFIYTEDISCFHSYVHFVLARERNIPFWCIGSGYARYRLAVYSQGFKHWDRLHQLYAEISQRGLTDAERGAAEQFIAEFRAKPLRPTGMDTRAKRPGIELADVARFANVATRYFGDRNDPTATPPWRAFEQRVRRMVRVRRADAAHMFESPVPGERYVLYPIHFQPEATTLVQAPMYLDQLALIQDIAKSLPIGYRLYVKEHLSNRGRRPHDFYQRLRDIPTVRLLGPDADTWALIRDAGVIAVITGTMGWEGLLFGKPVVTFGDVFFNLLPHVYCASEVPKDDWYALFQRAATDHRQDHDAVLAMIAAMQQASYPGFIGNATAFPEVLRDENIANITAALARELALPRRSAAAG